MSWMLTIGYNPHFLGDLREMLNLQLPEAELQAKLDELENHKPTIRDKLDTFTDRMEFVEQLSLVKSMIQKNGFMIDGHEVDGMDTDIGALRLYLSLTCIDIFASTHFKTFDEWLPDNCGDFEQGRKTLKDYISRKAKEYKDSYGVSSNFQKAFQNASDEIRNALLNNITMLDIDLGKNLIKPKPCTTLDDIVGFMLAVRNKYTHEGERVYYSEGSENDSILIVGIRNKAGQAYSRKKSGITIKKGCNLIALLRKLAIEECKKAIEPYGLK